MLLKKFLSLLPTEPRNVVVHPGGVYANLDGANVRASFACDFPEVTGSVYVNRKDLMAAMPAELATHNGDIIATGGGVKRTLTGFSAPEDRDIERTELPPLDIRGVQTAVGAVVHATSTDRTRVNIMGVIIEDGEVAATSGARVSCRNVERGTNTWVPWQLVKLFQALPGRVNAHVRPTYGNIQAGEVALAWTDSPVYPNWRRVMPPAPEETTDVKAADLLRLVKACTSSEGNNLVKLSVADGYIDICSPGRVQSGDVPTSNAAMQAEITVNGKYLQDALGAMTGFVQLAVFSEGNKNGSRIPLLLLTGLDGERELIAAYMTDAFKPIPQ